MKPKSLNFRISNFPNSRIEFFGGILCRILLVVFLIPLSKTFPQIPINGFCKFNSYIVEPSYTKIFALNFNNDSYNDLILFNPALKKILSLTGDPNGNFSQKKVFELPIEISRLQTLFDSKHNVIGYAFTSRKGLTAGIMNFSKDGKASLLKKIKFQSYPENISVSDINWDGEPEILISGSAFNGLSYLSQLKKEIKENKIVENEVINIPDIVPEFKGEKTPSQRMRACLYVLWEQNKTTKTFEEFYRTQMEKLIEFIKGKLEPRENEE